MAQCAKGLNETTVNWGLIVDEESYGFTRIS